MDVGQPTLDQLRIFLAVADEGSFNGAARKLGRAVSVVSYGIGAIEAQLGVKLFNREGSRRPELTEAGRALVADARAVIDDADGLMARARSIREGWKQKYPWRSMSWFRAIPSRACCGTFRRSFPP